MLLVDRKMENIEIKQHKLNALLPSFLKHMIYNLLFFLLFFIIYYVTKYFIELEYDFEIILYGSLITILVSILKLSKKIFFIYSHTYILTNYNVEDKYVFFKVHTKSMSYSNITDIKIKQDLWGRICKVGDMEFYTGNDSDSAQSHISLKNIEHPEKVKRMVHELKEKKL